MQSTSARICGSMPLTTRSLAHAALHDRVIITADTDFGELPARQAAEVPSVILFRRQAGRRPAMQAALVLEHLPDIQADLGHGAVIVIEERRVRVRRFPIDPETRHR
jgi:predicted nuclease of predicted toxin-antitoxin system